MLHHRLTPRRNSLSSPLTKVSGSPHREAIPASDAPVRGSGTACANGSSTLYGFSWLRDDDRNHQLRSERARRRRGSDGATKCPRLG